MKRITVSVDEKVVAAARKYAAARSTTVHQLVRDHLGEIADREARVRTARRRLRALSNHSVARTGSIDWTREQLHDR